MSEEHRYVRVCKVHGVDLLPGSLDCPKGHHADEWEVHDRKTGRVTSERVAIEEGELMPQQKSVKPPPIGSDRAAQSAFDERVARALPASPPSPPSPLKPGSLERRKFVDGSGQALFLTLKCEVSRKGFGGDPYRIRWRLEDTKSAKSQQGISATANNESEAREKFRAEIARAEREGWKSVPILFGRQTLKPIPAPRKKAS